MSESALRDISMEFAVDIVKLVRKLRATKEFVISDQICKSGTSIGANIREAQYAHSKADFISKLQIALKEANETGYWLELLLNTSSINQSEYERFDSLCCRIRVMLISSINTAKRNMERK